MAHVAEIGPQVWRLFRRLRVCEMHANALCHLGLKPMSLRARKIAEDLRNLFVHVPAWLVLSSPCVTESCGRSALSLRCRTRNGSSGSPSSLAIDFGPSHPMKNKRESLWNIHVINSPSRMSGAAPWCGFSRVSGSVIEQSGGFLAVSVFPSFLIIF